MSFSLKLFGGATIEGPEGPLAGRVAQRHRLALLALLAATGGGLSRDKVIAYLWPETGDDRARRLLSDSLYRIHKALGEGAVQTAGDELRLDAAQVPSDVVAFREAIAREEWALAVDLHGGAFLDGFHLPGAAEFERWVGRERARLGEDYARALEALAEEKAAEGDPIGAVACWRRRAAHDRYDSRVAMRLMEALEAAGNRAGALRHARVHEQLLEDEYGTPLPADILGYAERLKAGPGAGEEGIAEDEEVVPGEGEPAGEREAADEGVATSQPPVTRGVPSFLTSTGRLLLAAAVVLFLSLVLGWAFRSGPGDPPPPHPGLAVLPFENLGDDEESLYFADGVTEDILTSLSRVPGIRVVARASVMPFRDRQEPLFGIAEELGVTYLLQGSVRRSDDAIRIAVQLVDTGQGVQVWAESYDRPLEDIFAVQSDIARRVAGALQTRLTTGEVARIDEPPTDDLEAYNAYLRGRWFWHRRTRADLAQSARFFGRAIERDPEYARAWVGLADAYAVQAFYDYLPPAEAYPEAKRAATRALELDETLPEAHASIGYITLYYDWDAREAEGAFQRAVELDPGYSVGYQWYANLLVATGRFDEAARAMSRAREVNPLSLIANGALGWVYYYAGRHEEAVDQCDLALEMDPEWDLGHLWRGLALDALGRTDEAIASLHRAVDLSEGSGITVAALAHSLAAAGLGSEAREMLGDLAEAAEAGEYLPSFEIAKVHVALGEHAEALRWLWRAFDEHSHSMAFLEVDPQLAPIRDEPEFRRLVERVGLRD